MREGSVLEVPASGSLSPSAAAILSAVKGHGGDPFLVEVARSRVFSYGEFYERVCGLAAEFQQKGIRRGTRVAFLLPNGAELAVGAFASFALGAVAVPIHPSLSIREIQFILKNSRADALLYWPGMASLLKELDPPRGWGLVCGQPRGPGTDGSFLDIEKLSAPREFQPFAGASEEDLAVIVYSSGTTARPKGIAHRLSSMVRNATVFSQEHGVSSKDRFYGVLPMAYLGGLYNLLLLPFLRGASVVVDRIFDVRTSLNFWEQPMAHRVNALWLPPAILSLLLKIDRGKEGERFCVEGIRRVFSGFAPLPVKVKEAFEKRYGVPIHENYGLSETLFVSTGSARRPVTPGSVGRPLQGVEVRALPEEGESLPAGEGELCVRSPDLMAGYLDEQGEVFPEDPGAFFRTGDIGRLGPGGELFITGRKKDLIIRGGMNVSPLAIEETLREFDGVSDVAVVGIPHEIYGEDVVAVVKLAPGMDLASVRNGLAVYAQKRLASHQQPAHYLQMEEFPQTSTGKVRKGLLRQWVVHKLQLSTGD